MLATAPRIQNRIAGHIAPVPIPVPATPEDKQAAWGDAVFAAVLFYQAQLAHPDERVAERAARAIFELEKTRLRHGRELAGTVESMAGTVGPVYPEPPAFDPQPVEEPEDDDVPDEGDPEFLPEDHAAAERIAQTKRFAVIVGTVRERLKEEGIDGEEGELLANETARRMVLERIRDRRLATRDRPPDGGSPRRT